MNDPIFSEFEDGERQALLQVRSFITKHGTKEIDAYCATRLHDIRMDARHRQSQLEDAIASGVGALNLKPGALNFAPYGDDQFHLTISVATLPLSASTNSIRYRDKDGVERQAYGDISKGIPIPADATFLGVGIDVRDQNQKP